MNNWIKVAQISVTIISQAIIIMKEIQDEVKERDNQPHTDYLHIFKLQEDENILSITHEQEQPAYKLEYHYTNYVKNQNALPKKVYVIREDGVDAFYYVMLLPEEY